jgi:hypothetical protein
VSERKTWLSNSKTSGLKSQIHLLLDYIKFTSSLSTQQQIDLLIGVGRDLIEGRDPLQERHVDSEGESAHKR